MTRRYTITSGSYGNYRIFQQIEGKSSPALSTLRKQFESQWGLHVQKEHTAVAIINNIRLKSTVERNLQSAGYEGDSLPELFIDWLCKEHGFKRLKSDEFHFD